MGYHIQHDPDAPARTRPCNPENAWPGFCMQDVGQRFYSPGMGRWLNRDPIGEIVGPDDYGFCRNSPVDLWDILGLCVDGEETMEILRAWHEGGEFTGNHEFVVDQFNPSFLGGGHTYHSCYCERRTFDLYAHIRPWKCQKCGWVSGEERERVLLKAGIASGWTLIWREYHGNAPAGTPDFITVLRKLRCSRECKNKRGAS